MIVRAWSFGLVLLAFAFGAPARADWYEAQSAHFVIYADDSEKDIRRFSENLERYHSAMEFVTGRKVETPSPSNRVTIFVVGGQKEIRNLARSKSRTIGGYYSPRAGASKAFVQDIRNKSGYPNWSTIILLHEYAHHFLISSSRFAMPRWLSEGAAEFFAAASFTKDGGVMIGRPAQHRAGELAYAEDVSVRELLDAKLYQKKKGKRYDAFYGRSWLLYHFLTFNKERKGQLGKYWRELIEGKPPLEAAKSAFGDLDALEHNLDRYQRQRRMYMFALKPEMVPILPVSLRRLPEGEAAMMEVRIRSQAGVSREMATKLLVKAHEIAARYPDDPGVQTALAEAEFDAGNDAAAIAAADRAIALDPKRANAYVQKGYALFREARDAEDKKAAFRAAMRPFTALNKIEPDHPLPLIYYYRSFVWRGASPNETARRALERAAQLAPFDQGLWYDVAMLQASEGKIELAKLSLKSLAANPHGGKLAERSKALISLLDAAKEGEPFYEPATIELPELPEEQAE